MSLQATLGPCATFISVTWTTSTRHLLRATMLSLTRCELLLESEDFTTGLTLLKFGHAKVTLRPCFGHTSAMLRPCLGHALDMLWLC